MMGVLKSNCDNLSQVFEVLLMSLNVMIKNLKCEY